MQSEVFDPGGLYHLILLRLEGRDVLVCKLWARDTPIVNCGLAAPYEDLERLRHGRDLVRPSALVFVLRGVPTWPY